MARFPAARIAAEAARVAPRAKSQPLLVTYLLATLGALTGRLERTDARLSFVSMRVTRSGRPKPVEEAVTAKFWGVGLRVAKRQAKTG